MLSSMCLIKQKYLNDDEIEENRRWAGLLLYLPLFFQSLNQLGYEYVIFLYKK